MKAKNRYSRNILLLAILFLILCLLFRKIVFRNNTPMFYLTVLNLILFTIHFVIRIIHFFLLKFKSAILFKREIADNWITRAVNKAEHYALLIPGRHSKAREEERVLYAIQNGDVDFLTQRERKLYRIVKLFADCNMRKTTLEMIYAAVKLTDSLITYTDKAEGNAAYSLVMGKGVCSNYSRACQLLLASCNIKSLYVVGQIKGHNESGHAWLMVELDDGTYIHVDPTWTDSKRYNKHHIIKLNLKWLFINDKELSLTREWSDIYPRATGDSQQCIEDLSESMSFTG